MTELLNRRPIIEIPRWDKRSSAFSLKRGWIAFFLSFLVVFMVIPVLAEEPDSFPVLRGGLIFGPEKRRELKMRLRSAPMPAALYLGNFDEEGDFIAPKLGDPLSADLQEDIFLEGNLILPRGSLFLGRVSKVIAPARFGKAGQLELSFDRLLLPSGETILLNNPEKAQPVSAQLAAKRSSTISTGSKRLASHALGGAAAGGLVAIAGAGLLGVTAAPQYILASGAGVGLLVGVVVAVAQKGKAGQLKPGDELSFSIPETSLEALGESLAFSQKTLPASPASTAPLAPRPVLACVVHSKSLLPEGFFGTGVRLELTLTNLSSQSLSLSDLILLAPNGERLYAGTASGSPREDSLIARRLGVGESVSGSLDFAVRFPGLAHSLALQGGALGSIIWRQDLGLPVAFRPLAKRTFRERIFAQPSFNAWE